MKIIYNNPIVTARHNVLPEVIMGEETWKNSV